ncbi:MAG: histidine ammonia-lyase [Gemmatimonadota bacterium]|nr:MAG: histidine ammonia-lyase [Gemmatimonadota bacterium]
MVELDGNSLTIEDVVNVARRRTRFKVAATALARVAASRRFLEESIESGATIYGVNTGIGHLAQVVVAREDLVELQRNIVRSHAAGTGPDLSDEEVRAVLFLKVNLFAKGLSGVRPELVLHLARMLEEDILPVIPAKGSLGASGDLAPLSHVALAAIGEGEVRHHGKRLPAGEALRAAGLEPIELSYKEGLGIINGCQVMAGRGSLLHHDATVLWKTAQIVAAAVIDALGASETPFDPKVHRSRPYPGQLVVAANLFRMLSGERHRRARVQDAYSLRCVPQILGGIGDAFDDLRRRLDVELNAASDNPLVFAEEKQVIAAGNFHGESLALALDHFGNALAEIASLAERQLNRLLNPVLSGLPAFLASANGKNSGLMILQYTAASLVSENKILAHPASVDSIPVSADQEDHVSMGATAAHMAAEILRNVADVVGVTAMAAAQAMELQDGSPMAPSTRALLKAVRQVIPFWDQDRYAAADLRAASGLVRSGELLESVEREIGALEG